MADHHHKLAGANPAVEEPRAAESLPPEQHDGAGEMPEGRHLEGAEQIAAEFATKDSNEKRVVAFLHCMLGCSDFCTNIRN